VGAGKLAGDGTHGTDDTAESTTSGITGIQFVLFVGVPIIGAATVAVVGHEYIRAKYASKIDGNEARST
jgi:hypothetical protein